MKKTEDFAKIIKADGQQVLITKDYDDENFKIVQTVDMEGYRIELESVFESEHTRNEMFENYSYENAERYLEVVYDMLEDEY